MNTLSKDELRTLLEKSKGQCVSIFMPTRRGGAENQQNPVRFKRLLREAEERLIANGLRSPEVKELLEPAQKLLLDDLFWRQSEGIAMFLSPKVFRYYRLPFDFEEFVVVGDRFHLKPLLRLGALGGQFYILAISQNEVKLLEGTRHNISEVELEGVPKSLAEALKYDDPERQRQVHSSGAPLGAAIFHSHSVTEEAKDNILRYFYLVDKGLHELLREKKAPLLLACVEFLFPIYKEANSYPYLIEEWIEGNSERLSAVDLHQKAWKIVKPYFLKEQQEEIDRYRQLAGTGLTSNDVKETVPAAYYGRVDVLFVNSKLQLWGTFDPDTNEVHLHKEVETGDEDLLDFAAIHTYLNGGVVFAVESEMMPDGAPLAAIFRY